MGESSGGSGTDSSTSDPDEVSGESPVEADPVLPQQLRGTWERQGYGEIYVIGERDASTFIVTQQSCVSAPDVGPDVAPEQFSMIQTQALPDDALSVLFPGAAFPLVLNRLEQLPERCSVAADESAEGMFQLLWDNFNEYYAFFELRGVDWAERFEAVQPQLATVADDDAALFDVFMELLSPLDDGHVFIFNDEQGFSPGVERGLLARLEMAFEAQSEVDDFDIFVQEAGNQLESTLISYIDVDSLNGEGQLTWGTIEETTGYIFISGMEGFTEDGSASEEVAAASAAFDMALSELSETTQLILDVRLNGGGFDGVGLALASRFNGTAAPVLSKSARSSDGFQSQSVEAVLGSVDAPWTKPVVLLTSRDTASAAEIFTIAMRGLPNVTVMGENTQGILSDILVKFLPNGLVYGLSNEVYLDVDGVSFESVGVPPDVAVNPFDLEGYAQGRDEAIERALLGGGT